MDTISAEVEITCPPAEVFAFAADRCNRARTLPDNFTGFRLRSEQSTGLGARFSFTIHTDRGAYDSMTEIVAFEPPAHFTERTSEGDSSYETAWWFEPADGGTRVRAELRFARAGGLLNRLLGRFARKALGQSLLVELLRLKSMMEQA